MKAFASGLAVGLLALTCCGSQRVDEITFEGKLAPELTLTGNAQLEAQRDSWLCEGFLFQKPTRKWSYVEAKFERLGADGYRLRLDLRGTKQGGFCRYGLSVVNVEALASRDTFYTADVATITTRSSLAEGERPVSQPSPWSSVCKPRPAGVRGIDCQLVEQALADMSGVTTMKLNVAWSPAARKP